MSNTLSRVLLVFVYRRRHWIAAVLAAVISNGAPNLAHADGGQCRYEGGPGAPTYPQCLNQDCIGQGGYAQCTEPVPQPDIPFNESETDGEKFHYWSCPPGGLSGGYYCNIAGGSWSVSGCSGLPQGYVRDNALSTNNEALAISTATAAAGAWGSCGGITSVQDTGWFTNLGTSVCWGGGPTYTNQLLVHAVRKRTYNLGNGCGPINIEFLKHRKVECPVNYTQRTKANGDLQCVIPAECCEAQVGNPVSLVTGAKYQQELDYRSADREALEFKRYYNSKGYFRVPGILAPPPAASDYWRHMYQRQLNPISGNPGLMAILQREDGSLRHFDGAGKEVLNRNGAADRLQLVAGVGWTLTLANYDVERYDLSGRLTSITTRGGIATIVGYDPSGRVSSISNSFGRTLTLAYDTSNRLATVTVPGGGVIQYGYDSLDRLETVTYPDLKVRRYHYEDPNSLWLLSGITDESSIRFSTYTYDSSGRVSVSEHAGGVDRVTLTYGSASFTSANTSAIDAAGVNRGMAFSNQSGIWQKVYDFRSQAGDGSPDQYVDYDSQGNVTKRRQFPVGPSSLRYETTYAYDLSRNLETSRTEGKTQSGSTAVTRTITTQWDPVYRLPALISVYAGDTATGTPLRTTGFTYDGNGNTLTRTVTDPTVVPNVSRTWTYTYNSYGQMLTENGPRTDVTDLTTYTYYTCTTGYQCGQLNIVTNALSQVTTYNTYNAHGQPLTITDPNGIVTTLAYDARQRLTSRQVGTETTTFEYWPTGLLKKVVLPDSSFLLYTYDNAHRLTRIDDGAGNNIQYTLDAMGNRTAENVYDPTSFLTRTRTRIFNSLNQLWKELGAAGTPAVTTAFLYDANGNQTNINAPLSRNTVNAYDELNRLKQITDPASGVTQFGYDANDNLTSVTDPRSLATNYTYTGFGDLKTQVSPDTGTTTNTYDSGGNLKTSTDARNKTGTYSYDALNRVTQVAYGDQTISYTYDAGTNGKGHLTGASDSSHSMSWTYDAQGRLTGKGQTVGAVTKSIGYGYTNGQLASIVTPSGQTVTYGYTNGQATSIAINGTTLLHSALYEPFGPVRQWSWGNGTLTARTYDEDGRTTQVDSKHLFTYDYDEAGRIDASTNSWDANHSWTYGYDALDRITSATRPTESFTWTYDANGNRLTQINAATDTYTISGTSNRISSISGGLTRTYGYDAAGNTSGYGNVVLAYNNRGRMKTATVAGTVFTYVYNALGQLVKKSGTGVTLTYFMYDEAGHLLGEYNSSGALIQETVWLGDTPVATIRPKTGGVDIFYVHTDHLNTPRRVTRPSDNKMRWRWDINPFTEGGVAQNPEGLGTFVYNLRSPGQIEMPESGLRQNYFRDYDRTIGRYVESDPIGLDGGINTYAYANSNPVNMVDPFGLMPLWPLLNLPKRDSCKPQEWRFCEGKCAPGIAKGCYVSVSWKLKGIRGGEPIRSEQRTVNCDCQNQCDNSSRVFVPILSPAPVFFPVTSPVMVPVFP